MFSSRRSNNLINRIHERSLRTVYNDTSGTFQEPLQRNRSVSIHYNNKDKDILSFYSVIKKFFDFRENRCNIENSKK